MSQRKRFPGTAMLVIFAAMAALVFFWGCSKEPPASHEDHTGHEHTSASQPAAQQQPQQTPTQEQASAGQTKVETVAIEQKTCPVMEGNPINKNLFVEYKGKKVYFCCAGCPEKFLADPEKYVAKLPQFKN